MVKRSVGIVICVCVWCEGRKADSHLPPHCKKLTFLYTVYNNIVYVGSYIYIVIILLMHIILYASMRTTADVVL